MFLFGSSLTSRLLNATKWLHRSEVTSILISRSFGFDLVSDLNCLTEEMIIVLGILCKHNYFMIILTKACISSWLVIWMLVLVFETCVWHNGSCVAFQQYGFSTDFSYGLVPPLPGSATPRIHHFQSLTLPGAATSRVHHSQGAIIYCIRTFHQSNFCFSKSLSF